MTLPNPLPRNECIVVPIALETHPYADMLSLVKVGPHTIVVRTDEWRGETTGIFVPHDTLVPSPNGEMHVKCKKLRGVLSEGLLLPNPGGFEVGTVMTQHLNAKHYDPPEPDKGGIAGGPPYHVPVYDVEAFERYPNVFHPEDTVVIREKIHGSNFRITFDGEQLWVGSRKLWKAPGTELWRVAAQYPELVAWCHSNPNRVVYAEMYGKQGGYNYGLKAGQAALEVFSVYDAAIQQWHYDGRILDGVGAPTAPLLLTTKWGPDVVELLAKYRDAPFQSKVPTAPEGHMAEGVVCAAVGRTWCPELKGYPILKVVTTHFKEGGHGVHFTKRLRSVAARFMLLAKQLTPTEWDLVEKWAQETEQHDGAGG